MIQYVQGLLVPIASIVILLVFVGLVLARLYRRSTREVSLVKTGAGGRRVIMDGGTIVIPLLHEISPVNMKTLRLEVRRWGEGSLITKDRMRVDVGVEFYVSVQANEDGIAKAAQTLGDKTFNIEGLREMIEGKLVDGLRSVAAKMTMDELHENRAEFVQQVQNAVSEDLLKNGLMLETVSLTALDQTSFESLDENNAFNAIGMRKLAEVIAESKKRRAEIDADAETAVRQSAMEAAKRKLTIDREEEEARIAQAQELATLRAAQEAEIAQREEEGARAREEARILRERQVREAEIAREEAVRAAEIENERRVRAAEIEKEEAVRSAEIAKERQLEVADQERQIVIAAKSEEESRARASADAARAEAVKAAEAITTARETAEAERLKQVALIDAAREAEREAVAIRLAATAEKEAAADRAAALREEAQAEAEAMTIRAEAKKADKLAEAEGQRALVDAENAISTEIAAMKVQLARLEALPAIVAEMVKPAEKIDSIKIHHVTGLHGNGGGAGAGVGVGGNAGAGPVNQAVDAISAMAVQLPALKKLGEEVGISLEEGLAGVVASAGAEPARGANGAAPAPAPREEG
ncbi:MAG: flotillin domain-containing protein [Pseudomonadota bacterium]